MSSPSGAEHDSSRDQQQPQPAPGGIGTIRLMFWSIRREIWENRSIYIAPLAAAGLYVVAFVIHTLVLRVRKHGVWNLNAAQQHDTFVGPHEYAVAVIMATAVVVGIFYTLDALYGERRDRSILFWKSLPVSDLITVLSKITVPLFVLPLFGFVLSLVTQFVMLLLMSIELLGSGVGLATIWTASSPFHTSWLFFYHIFTIHGLWYAPLYAWLLLVSAWAPRAPIIWAFLPPFVVWFVEKTIFQTSYFWEELKIRLLGPSFTGSMSPNTMDPMAVPSQFFVTPGLWIGLGFAALFLAAAVRLRRYRGPI